MIRYFIYGVLALATGSALALMLASDPGYVLINYRGTTVEATLATVIATFVLLVLLASMLTWLLRLLNPLRWFHPGGRAGARSEEGLQFLLIGRWQEAYKLLVENAERVDIPEVNYLLAAVAAFQRNDATSWHWCLDQAERHERGNTHGIRSFRALLETRAGHPELALPILLAVQRLVPTSPFVLTQIKDIYVAEGRWDELATLMPELEKHKVVESGELKTLSANAYARRLENAALASVDSMREAWQDLPKTVKHDEQLLGVYVRKLLECGKDTEAGALLTSHLKKDWSDNLVGMLGFVHVRNPQEALAMMESWLRQHPNNPVLLLTLGRLSLRNQLWGKAREYFESGLRVTNSPELVAELNAELARLLEHLGERESSLACYQKALVMLKHPLPDVPLPVKR
ncbi:MAG: heme biosynthesis protein HemY [Burkholderiales bacterium]